MKVIRKHSHVVKHRDKWRARVLFKGKQRVGPVRKSRLDAHDDALAILRDKVKEDEMAPVEPFNKKKIARIQKIYLEEVEKSGNHNMWARRRAAERCHPCSVTSVLTHCKHLMPPRKTWKRKKRATVTPLERKPTSLHAIWSELSQACGISVHDTQLAGIRALRAQIKKAVLC